MVEWLIAVLASTGFAFAPRLPSSLKPHAEVRLHEVGRVVVGARIWCKAEQHPALDTAVVSTSAGAGQLQPTAEQVASIFAECDTSGDGFIDLSELEAALAKAGQPVSRARATALLDQVDANGDGQISLEEFQQVFQRGGLGGLAGMLDRLVEEVVFEVSGTQFNGPILFAASTAAFVGAFGKYVAALSTLQQGASWLPESLALAQSIPAGFLADYAQAAELAPLLTMACTSCLSYAVGDLVAQRVEGRWRVGLLDLRRCARNAALGFGLHGPLVFWWINVLEGPLADLLGEPAGAAERWGGLLLKIALDQTFFSALINLLYASLNGLLSGDGAVEAFARARRVLVPAMVSSWRFWPAVQLISYSPLVPLDFKLLWIDTMEILWVAYLSATVNSAPGSEPEAVPWGEARLAEEREGGIGPVLDEPGDSANLSAGPVALFASAAALSALTWPSLVVQLMTAAPA